MDLGVALPQWGPYASPDAITTVAEEAERMGLASLWVQERLLKPTKPKQGYGGMAGLDWPRSYECVYDPLETLTWAAAKTSRVKLGTSVLDILFHTPVLLAKRLASLDQLSGGRLIVGVGQGWSEDEFDASNVPLKRRGAGQGDFIKAMKAAWGPDPVSYSGRFYRIPESIYNPKPAQAGGPPVIFGAFAPPSIQRAAELGDGLNPIAIEWGMLEGLVGGYRQAVEAAGRDPAAMQIVVRANNALSETPVDGERPPLGGSPEQVAEDLERVGKLGIDHVFFDPGFAETPIDVQLRVLEKIRGLAPR
jgi:probable F420-dependent oxidoreductase